MKNNIAFTLIELITVLVTVGVLAAIAFPGVIAQIERHRAQEAINTLGVIRNAMESCGVSQAPPYNFTNCNSWGAINMLDPSYNTPAGSNMGSHFTYDPFTPAPGNGTYTVVATRTNSTGNTVTITRASNAQVTCAGLGAYAGFC